MLYKLRTSCSILALLRVSGSIQKSTEVMQAMQRLVNVPEVAATMREMSKEMMKAGIMEEMIEETMESIEPDMEDMEEQAQEEIDKVCLLFFSVLRQGWHILSASQ